MWHDESDSPYRSPSYSGIERPGKVPRTGKTEMGEDHGCQTPQNVDLVSNLSPGHSIWTPTETTEITLMNGTIRRYWKAACSETGTCSLGEGSQKSALAIRQLAGFLSYIEAHFGIMRRLADYYLNKAPALDEMKKAHRKFIRDYNTQIHFAHRERQDQRHSPQDVLRGVLARTVPAPTLARIFFAMQFTRHLDRSGYIRCRRWRFYAEAGLAKQSVTIHIYTSTLKIEYQDTELAFYTMAWAEDNKHIKDVKNPRVIETGYRSPQLTLWTLGPDEWLLFLKLPDYAARKKPRGAPEAIQLPLPVLDGDHLLADEALG